MRESDALDLDLPQNVREESDAVISDCGLYRYHLIRRWGPGKCCVFVMLNPSTADASADDPTIRRCRAFAKRFGCDALAVVNVYGWRATRPVELWRTPDPVGPLNDRFIRLALDCAKRDDAPVVAAWGANARPGRVLTVSRLGRFQCLGVTKAGAPRHPLYLRSDEALTPWPVASVA